MQIVILAAGQGKRLGALAQGLPKCLVPVKGGTPYLHYQLISLAQFDFSKKVIVGGYGFDHLQGFLTESGCTDIELVLNPDYHKGNLFTLLAAKRHITEGFYLFNADHFYSPQNYQKIFAPQGSEENIKIYCDQDRVLTADDMKVGLSGQGVFARMEKSLVNYSYGYVGVTYVPQKMFFNYWQAVVETAAVLGDQANVEAVVNRLALAGEAIRIVDISGSWWTEIDTAEDLERAKKVMAIHCP